MADEITPGWYPEPTGGGGLRYWDGADWTDHVQADETEVPQPVPDIAVVTFSDSLLADEPRAASWRPRRRGRRPAA